MWVDPLSLSHIHSLIHISASLTSHLFRKIKQVFKREQTFWEVSWRPWSVQHYLMSMISHSSSELAFWWCFVCVSLQHVPSVFSDKCWIPVYLTEGGKFESLFGQSSVMFHIAESVNVQATAYQFFYPNFTHGLSAKQTIPLFPIHHLFISFCINRSVNVCLELRRMLTCSRKNNSSSLKKESFSKSSTNAYP